MRKRPLFGYIKGFYVRCLHYFAKNTFPGFVRVFLHRARGVHIGHNVLIGVDVHIDDDDPSRITIEDDVFVTTGVIFLTHQRDLSNYVTGTWIGNQPMIEKEIHIKKGAHIGIRAIILPGVTIGEGAVIGAGSVVTHDIPPYSVAVGVPARVIKSL